MTNEKDKFGETMKLLERAKEDIYFAELDRELIEKLRVQLRKVEPKGTLLRCPKCSGQWGTYSFQGIILDRCDTCDGIWFDKGELAEVIRRITNSPIHDWLKKVMFRSHS